MASSRQQVSFDRDLRAFYGTVQNALREITLDEIRGQVRLGNDQFQLVVDGRRGAGLAHVRRRVRVDFATVALAEAVRDIENRVRKLSPKRSGRFVKSWQWELNGRPVNASSLTSLDQGDVLRYLNFQPYVRKAVTRYGSRLRRSRRRNKRRESVTLVASEGLTERVRRLTRRKYRGLSITDEWLRSHPRWPKPASAKDGSLPTITIRLARGTLRS